MSQPAEGRSLWVVVEKIPMPVLGRGQAGKDARDCAGAITQHRPQRHPIRKQVREEVAALQQTPSESVDQHEDVQSRSTIHVTLSWPMVLTCGCRKRETTRMGRA